MNLAHIYDWIDKFMFLRIIGMLLAFSFPAMAGVITDVRNAIARNEFQSANAMLVDYKVQHGIDPEYLEAAPGWDVVAIYAR